MDFEILHDLPGRLRVRCRNVRLDRTSAKAIGELLSLQDGVRSVEVSVRTGNLLLHYSRLTPKQDVLSLLAVLEPDDWDGFGRDGLAAPPSIFELSLTAILKTAAAAALKRLFLPLRVRHAIILIKALPYLFRGLLSLLRGRIGIAVLDAAALSILSFRRDFAAIRTIVWMFSAADSLEGWTREQSRHSLTESLALKIDSVWVKTAMGEAKRPMAEIRPGDLVVVRTGGVIPVDGVVEEGEALINQSVLTGESSVVHKYAGLAVFAGTVIDEGGIVVRVDKAAGETRLQAIIKFIEESESLKADVQSRAERLADAIAPYSFFAALLVLALTRDSIRSSAVLMVDYSCAIRMSTPLTILSAIREGVSNGVLVKGGKYMEAVARADCLVIDKTGTLTLAKPSVARVAAFEGWNQAGVLRDAACIEEHFPHPVGRAVVKKAESENLRHQERHAKPEYILAHGIASELDGKQVLIGSSHFIFEDSRVPGSDEAERETRLESDQGRSLLYMAHGAKLVGMLAIEDPIRPDAAKTLAGLSRNGIGRIVMLTGDSERTAQAVAEKLGIGSFRANLLPAEKAAAIGKLKKEGHKVIFIGDGVNDSPALSAADVGVSLKDGSDIAKEVAGVVLMDGRLSSLATVRVLSRRVMDRINRQFGFIMLLNSVLLGLGLFGGITPRLAALLHNLGTVLVTANSVKGILAETDVDDGGGA